MTMHPKEALKAYRAYCMNEFAHGGNPPLFTEWKAINGITTYIEDMDDRLRLSTGTS